MMQQSIAAAAQRGMARQAAHITLDLPVHLLLQHVWQAWYALLRMIQEVTRVAAALLKSPRHVCRRRSWRVVVLITHRMLPLHSFGQHPYGSAHHPSMHLRHIIVCCPRQLSTSPHLPTAPACRRVYCLQCRIKGAHGSRRVAAESASQNSLNASEEEEVLRGQETAQARKPPPCHLPPAAAALLSIYRSELRKRTVMAPAAMSTGATEMK